MNTTEDFEQVLESSGFMEIGGGDTFTQWELRSDVNPHNPVTNCIMLFGDDDWSPDDIHWIAAPVTESNSPFFGGGFTVESLKDFLKNHIKEGLLV